jgi:hypothetical protein
VGGKQREKQDEEWRRLLRRGVTGKVIASANWQVGSCHLAELKS